MIELRGITIAVNDWYAATLAICLPRNMRHFTECLVVTAPGDEAVKAVASKVAGVRILETDAFTRYGASFNKGLAMEEGFDALGRDGWIAIWDSDCLWPEQMPLGQLRPTALHGAKRRILANPNQWTPDLDWRKCPVARDGGPIGHTQIFHASDPAIRDKRPWYDVSFAHAGGGDAYMLTHWGPNDKPILPVEVLHLGPKDTHWFGTDPESKKVMEAFIVRNGWRHSHPWILPEAANAVGDITERVEVPGYAPSGFELPFVRRAQWMKANGRPPAGPTSTAAGSRPGHAQPTPGSGPATT
jgi:hypothetical protein